ncbi:precorrin-3B C(17)-methyltransferase [Xanthobacter sp. TB0136]|uniref:precorrin-3B C(17)-methyltransferase n=1 Tax=Xanthobacter sp. TB0136 TaxID=3459177 RepID=UPI004039A058
MSTSRMALQPGGCLTIIGLGPGDARYLTPAARAALDAATDLIGYFPYVERVPERPGLKRHASDNRVELDRSRHALELAAAGARVAVVSGGDPGVFAMAAAVFEAMDTGPDHWRALPVAVEPGITAMLAAAARAGAPLGGDFCAISLSDNLKPWALVAKRLDAALGADFAIALYNPVSKARPHQLDDAFAIARTHRAPDTPVLLARAVGRAEESLRIVPLGDVRGAMADMSTLVLIGASTTRMIPKADGGAYLYTPRFHKGLETQPA